MGQSRHGIICVLFQHLSVSIEKGQDCRCPVDIRNAHLSNRNAVQPYHCVSLLVTKYCSDCRLPPWCSRGVVALLGCSAASVSR